MVTRKNINLSSMKSRSKERYFPVVGIGASAGGLEALEKFFKNMPEGNGMAFVVIQHLDPDYHGVMPELLQRVTSMRVLQATEELKIRPDHVYIIPPNKTLEVKMNVLYLSNPVQPRGLRLPIDIFFRSLAINSGENGIGIILSGMGSDGSLGVKAIKEMGGLVLIQDPSDSKFDGMPRSAIQSVNADLISTADDLPAKLIDFLKISPGGKKEAKTEYKNGVDKIISLLRQKTGHDFALYKKTTLLRRIERRQEVHKINQMQDYIRFLMGNPVEIEILFKELLIGVTNFFRDPAVWKKLKENILPDLINELYDGQTIRAWVTSCSTGEEAYSLAIVFREAVQEAEILKNINLQIFATDIDHDAIEKARRGIFSSNIAIDVPPELLGRYFVPEGDGYRINASIREMIVFAEQNVIRDPPFTKLDILSCRNLLIYMEPELQKKLFALYYYALKPGGILILGSSESFGNKEDWFREVDSKMKIYKRSTGFSTNILLDTPSSFYHQKTPETEKKMPLKTVENIQTLADQFILQNYSPASVIVNEKGDIVYIAGHTGKYLEPVAGKANWNIYAMAHDGFRHELPAAFRQAEKRTDPVIIRNAKIGTRDNVQYTDIKIEHIKARNALNDLIIVAFVDVEGPVEPDAIHRKTINSPDTGHLELEDELRKTNEELQSTREEMQTSQEELKSTNEELQSTNEELQSTNEELTTSKEEMQSLNEELQTVNSELQSKINDLTQANNDMKNLLNSTEIATLFLDKKLNIRRFTDPVVKIFNIRTADIGRPYTDLVNNLHYQMDEDTHKVLKDLTPIVTEAKTNSDLWFSIRIMPYRTYDDHIDGLVITFTDITLAKKLELELMEANIVLRKDKT
jgi:two-component system, chemotaxis family, CheB/CheR fusion protein